MSAAFALKEARAIKASNDAMRSIEDSFQIDTSLGRFAGLVHLLIGNAALLSNSVV